jgi:hypothetical protein
MPAVKSHEHYFESNLDPIYHFIKLKKRVSKLRKLRKVHPPNGFQVKMAPFFKATVRLWFSGYCRLP